MMLIVPFLIELTAADKNLIRLAEFLGIECQALDLGDHVPGSLSGLASLNRSACLVVNPQVIREWTGGLLSAGGFSSSLQKLVSHVLVHAVRADDFDSQLVSALSGGRFEAVREAREGATFAFSADQPQVCDGFAGLNIGSSRSTEDRVFVGRSLDAAKILISIDGRPLLASVETESIKAFFVGNQNVADIDVLPGDEWIGSLSSFLPLAMVLRSIFVAQCWRAVQQHACVVVDDPLLHANYGFLNFKRLLELMEEHNFHTTIGFIPHNFRRTSAKIARIFQQHRDRLSLCFHGNDHTGGEFSSTNSGMVNTMLHMAEKRIRQHTISSGLDCDRVMVFPQGRFSVEAMEVLRAHNFDGAINTTPHPRQFAVRLPLRELAQPAVLRYGGFPLFLRKSSTKTRASEIAFKLFFGIPIFIGEHHDAFKDPQALIDVVERVNAVAPAIRWSSAGDTVRSAVLGRSASDGMHEFRAYSRAVRIVNSTKDPMRAEVEWPLLDAQENREAVMRDDTSCGEARTMPSGIRVSTVISPESSALLSLHNDAKDPTVQATGLRYRARVFVRRRLSEIRDNYISKSPVLVAATKGLQQKLHNK